MARKVNQAKKVTIDDKKSSKHDIAGPDLDRMAENGPDQDKKWSRMAKDLWLPHSAKARQAEARSGQRSANPSHNIRAKDDCYMRLTQQERITDIMAKSPKASIETAKHPAEKSKRKAKANLASPSTHGKNQAGQTNGQNEMTIKERGKSNNTSAGGAPRQVY